MGEIRPDASDNSSEVVETRKRALEARQRQINHRDVVSANVSALEASIESTKTAAASQQDTIRTPARYRAAVSPRRNPLDGLGQMARTEGAAAVAETALTKATQVYAGTKGLLDAGHRALADARQQLAEIDALLKSGDSNG